MTTDKHRKRRIRELAERMQATYSTARQAFLAGPGSQPGADTAEATALNRPLSPFQSSVTQPDAGHVGETAQRLLSSPLGPDQQPTEAARSLEVSLFWGDTLIDVRCYPRTAPVRIGPSETADFRVYDAALVGTFELFADGCIAAPPRARLSILREDADFVSAEGQCPLGLGDRALISLASTQLVVRWVRPTAKIEARRFEALDLYFTRALSATFLFHVFLLAALWIAPVSEERLSEGLFGTPPTLTKATFTKAPRPVVPSFHPHLPAAALAQHDNKTPRPANISHAHSTPGGRAQVLRAGLLDGNNMAALLNGPNRVIAALNGLSGGPKIGGLGGAGGFGTRGVGPGTGGPEDIAGGIGTRGIGSGPRGSMSIGSGHKPAVVIDRAPTRISGDALSKEVIASIVRKHENEIRYCYETALSTQHDLAGKVSVAFTIGGTGDVSEANVGESTLGSSSAESCIATKVRRWKFPEPKGGGQVFVTYPWIFRPAGGD